MSVVFLLLGISEKLLTLVHPKTPDDLILYASVLELFVFAIPLAFYLKARDKNFFDTSKMRGISFSDLPFALSGASTFIFGSVIILYLQMNFLDTPTDVSIFSVASNPRMSTLGVFTFLVLVPALAEELLFRGVIITEYSGFRGPVTVVISAIFFAMIHFSFAEFPFYFFSGLVLGTLTYVLGSSLPSIVIHLLYNTIIVFFGDALGVFLSESSTSIILAFFLVSAFLGSLISFLSTMEDVYEKKSAMYEAGVTPGKRKEILTLMSRAGRMGGKSEKKARAGDNAFLSPTFFMTVALFILITLDVI